jgi:hypothetical protein
LAVVVEDMVLAPSEKDIETVVDLAGPGERLASRVRGLARAAARDARDLIRPAAVYDILTVEGLTSESLTVAGETFSGGILLNMVRGATEIVVVVGTIGPELEERVTRLMAEGRALEGLVLDTVGNLLAGQVVRTVLDRVEAIGGRRGLRMGAPVSPGQADWDLSQQRALFSLLRPGVIGVRLTEEMVMMPRKSISVMAGLGENVTHGGSVCDVCAIKHSCRYRKVASS